jgi:hypothetical protein
MMLNQLAQEHLIEHDRNLWVATQVARLRVFEAAIGSRG